MTDVIERAAASAAAAADAAGVTLGELADIDEMRRAADLFDTVWGRDPASGRILAPEMLVAIAHAGGQVTGAHRDGELVGATAAIIGLDDACQPILHSHVTGVLATHVGEGIGWALKLHQRSWALRRGLEVVRWTFDPLVRRNAVLNLVKLGARVDAYDEDRYGSMPDARNAGLPTDRLVAAWHLTERRVEMAVAGRPAEPDVTRLRGTGAVEALTIGADGEPLVTGASGDHLLVAVPADIERLRVEEADRAAAWAAAIRSTLGRALSSGYRVTGFARDGWYVLARDRRVEELA